MHSSFTPYSPLRSFWYSDMYIYFCFFLVLLADQSIISPLLLWNVMVVKKVLWYHTGCWMIYNEHTMDHDEVLRKIRRISEPIMTCVNTPSMCLCPVTLLWFECILTLFHSQLAWHFCASGPWCLCNGPQPVDTFITHRFWKAVGAICIIGPHFAEHDLLAPAREVNG